MELTVAGKVIGTTEQHPFHVKDRDWIAANELSPGDLLTTDHADFFAAVEATALTDRVVPVYNLSVEHDHTYFVSYDDWDFGVWAHNTYSRMSADDAFENGLSSRDSQWPWRGLHETVGHHPLMQGKSYKEYWNARGLSNADVDDWVVHIDVDIHRAITESGWWDREVLGRIAAREARVGVLSKNEVLHVVKSVLAEVLAWGG